MKTHDILDPTMLHLLWGVPVLLLLFLYAGWRRSLQLESFAAATILKSITATVCKTRRRWKIALFLLGVSFAAIALSRPVWTPKPHEVEREGRDVVFLLDVSRSMLAEDLAPNRLERARIAIGDCLEALQGDRVGLVVFSGTAVVKCPLTIEYGFFRMMLEDAKPEHMSRGGTMIGDAIRKAVHEVFQGDGDKYRDIILITDGEDQKSLPTEAAKEAGERGIRIFAIGLGDENEGKRIPITDSSGRTHFLKDKDGKEVWSQLKADALRDIAHATPNGAYVNVGTGAMDLGALYRKLIASAEKKRIEQKTINKFEEKFQIFLAVAFAFLCLELCIGERRKEAA